MRNLGWIATILLVGVLIGGLTGCCARCRQSSNNAPAGADATSQTASRFAV